MVWKVPMLSGGGEAHLCVGQVENKVLPLVLYVIALETKEQTQPIEEVHGREPLEAWWPAEVADSA